MITSDCDCAASGIILEDGTLNVRWCSIQTDLILLTGRFCDFYACDIIEDINSIQKKIDERTLETETIWFGFRDCGIDHETTIRDTLSNPEEYGFSPYREIWKLDIIVSYKYHSIHMYLSKATNRAIEMMLEKEGD